MKAEEEILIKHKDTNYEPCYTYWQTMNAMQEYARIQIEKDRDEIKKLLIKKGLKKDAPILKAIDNLPITLD